MSSSTSNSKTRQWILRLTWLLLCIFLFDRAAYFLLDRAENSFYNQSGFELAFQEFVRGQAYSTLLMGTSRTYEGLHPLLINQYLNQKAYKESSVGKGPRYFHHFYKLYKKYAGIPQVVIYGVDYFVYNITSNPKWLSRFDLRQEKNQVNFFSAPLLLVEQKRKTDNFINNAVISIQDIVQKNEEKGFAEFTRIQEYLGADVTLPEFVIDRPPEFIKQKFPRPPGIEGDYFDALIGEMVRDGVTVILLVIPDHIGTGTTNYERKRFYRDLTDYSKKYGGQVVFINFNTAEKFPLDDPTCFINGGWGKTNSHLSKKGAQILNEKLCEEIRPYYRE